MGAVIVFCLLDFGLVQQWNVEVLRFLLYFFLILFLILPTFFVSGGGGSCHLQHRGVLRGGPNSGLNPCVIVKPLSILLENGNTPKTPVIA